MTNTRASGFRGYFQKSAPDSPTLRLVIGSPVPSPRIPRPDEDARDFAANLAAQWRD